jgi:hypothetical protein
VIRSTGLWYHLTWRFHSVLPHTLWHGTIWAVSDVAEKGILLCSVLWSCCLIIKTDVLDTAQAAVCCPVACPLLRASIKSRYCARM